MFAELLGFPSGELGPAVIFFRIGFQTGDYYENTYFRSDSLLTDVHRSHSVALLRPARPAFMITMKQVGSNVEATGSGAINLTGLTFVSGGFVATGSIEPEAFSLWPFRDGTGLSQYTGFSGP